MQNTWSENGVFYGLNWESLSFRFEHWIPFQGSDSANSVRFPRSRKIIGSTSGRVADCSEEVDDLKLDKELIDGVGLGAWC